MLRRHRQNVMICIEEPSRHESGLAAFHDLTFAGSAFSSSSLRIRFGAHEINAIGYTSMFETIVSKMITLLNDGRCSKCATAGGVARRHPCLPGEEWGLRSLVATAGQGRPLPPARL